MAFDETVPRQQEQGDPLPRRDSTSGIGGLTSQVHGDARTRATDQTASRPPKLPGEEVRGHQREHERGSSSMIRPGSTRTFFEALDKAQLPHPTTYQEIGDAFFTLMILGIDHELVGSSNWYQKIEDASQRRDRGL